MDNMLDFLPTTNNKIKYSIAVHDTLKYSIL